MENVGIALFVFGIVAMILFVMVKRKKDAARRAAENERAAKEQEKEWALSEFNVNSPFFNKQKYEELQKKIAAGDIRMP